MSLPCPFCPSACGFGSRELEDANIHERMSAHKKRAKCVHRVFSKQSAAEVFSKSFMDHVGKCEKLVARFARNSPTTGQYNMATLRKNCHFSCRITWRQLRHKSYSSRAVLCKNSSQDANLSCAPAVGRFVQLNVDTRFSHDPHKHSPRTTGVAEAQTAIPSLALEPFHHNQRMCLCIFFNITGKTQAESLET